MWLLFRKLLPYDVNPCTFNNSYHNIIAIFTTDLNPSASRTTSVRYSIQNSSFLIHFDKVQLFGDKDHTEFSFAAQLWESGRITLYYEAITSLTDIAFEDSTQEYHELHTIVGLRPPQPIPDSIVKETLVSPPPLHGSKVYYHYKKGMYVDPKKLSPGSAIDFCPISTQWCLEHNVTFNMEGGGKVYLTTPFVACFQVFPFYCSFGDSLVEATVEHQQNFSLSCQIPPALEPGEMPLRILYRTDDDTLEEVRISPPLNLTSVAAVTLAPQKRPVCNTDSNDVCSVCGQCGGLDFSCLGCDNQTLFSRYDCFGSCGGDGILDVNGNCCSPTKMDCNGLCNGTGIIGKEHSYDIKQICCEEVDCSGTCSGQASIDGCGTCSGGDTGLIPVPDPAFCSHHFEIGQRVLRMEISSISQTQEANSKITLTNSGDALIYLEFFHEQRYSPKLQLSIDGQLLKGNVSLPANTSMELVVTSSYKDFLAHKPVNVKYPQFVSIKYFFPGGFNVQEDQLKVFATLSNCSGITDFETCLVAPGCMLCLQTTDQRLLAAEGGAFSDLLSNEYQIFPHRKLMPSLFPDIEEATLTGSAINSAYCTEGSDTSACDALSSARSCGTLRHRILISQHSPLFFTSMLWDQLMIWTLFFFCYFLQIHLT